MKIPYMLSCRLYVIPENECGRFLRILALADPLPYSYGASVGGLTDSSQFRSSAQLEQNVLNHKGRFNYYFFAVKPTIHIMKHLVLILLVLALTACQFGGERSNSPQVSKKKIDHDPAAGRLFSSIFKKKPSKTILLPPDLISSASDKVRENHEEANLKRQQQVLPEVTGADVIFQDGKRWLRVETGPQAVWDRLVEFWAEQQIGLVESQPAAGLMETEWIDRNAPSEGEGLSIARLFGRITGAGVLLDKFRIRIERESDRATRVFVSHRSTERKEINLSSRKNSQLEWVSGQSDEKETQLLQVLVQLFVGLESTT